MKAVSAKKLTRRRFLETTSTAFVGGALVGALPLEGTASSEARPADDWPRLPPERQKQRLLKGWDHHRGSLGGIWEVWRKSANDVNLWPPVTFPHCFNAADAVDPDTPYYQGPGWYRANLGTSTGARKLELYNGRAVISVERKGEVVVSVSSERIKPAFLTLKN